MWLRSRILSRTSVHPPDAAYVELVDMMLRPIVPVAFVGAALCGVGLLVAARKQDVAILILTVAATFVDAASIVFALAYRRRAAAGPVSAEEARRWERGFALGLFAFAALLGAINLRGLAQQHPVDSALVPMLTSGLTLVFVGGVGACVAFRPRLCVVAALLAVAPTVAGLAGRAAEAHDPYVGAGFVLQAVLLSGFALAALTWASSNYELARQQIVAKLDFAHMARRDELTGLANRVQLRERFDDAYAAIGAGTGFLALHCLDLDRFKAVNDAYGHATGDALLQAATERLLAAARREDTVARLGGDEFVVVQTGIRHGDEARLLARRIVKMVGAPYRIGDQDIQIGVSVGVALAPRDGTTLETLIARADAALYDAKRAHRGGGLAFWGEAGPGPGSSPPAATSSK